MKGFQEAVGDNSAAPTSQLQSLSILLSVIANANAAAPTALYGLFAACEEWRVAHKNYLVGDLRGKGFAV